MKSSRTRWLAIFLVSAAMLATPARAGSCGGGTATFTNTTSTGIPAPGTVTSTILPPIH